MKIIKQKVSSNLEQLSIWKELFGGTIHKNQLNCSNGNITIHTFSEFEITIFNAKFLEKTSVQRSYQGGLFPPIIFSDNISFEPQSLKEIIATKNKTSVTGVFFSNAENSITYPQNQPFCMVSIKLTEEGIAKFCDQDDSLIQIVNKSPDTFIYQLFTPDMKLSYQQLIKKSGVSKFDQNMIYAHSILLVSYFFAEANSRVLSDKKSIDIKKKLLIIQVKNKLLEDLSSPIRMGEFVHMTGMCESYIRLYFKQIYGMSINSFYQFYRMQKAKELLEQQQHSISQIADLMGYSHLGHFIKMFKRQYNMTPKKYQNLSNSD